MKIMTEFILYHPTFPKNIGSWKQLITTYFRTRIIIIPKHLMDQTTILWNC